MSDPRDLGQLVGTLSACLSEAMLRAITLCSKLDGDKNKQSFLKQFRAGLLASGRETAYVDKTMTTMNQCCLKGMVFYCMDPKLNKVSQVRQSKGTGAFDYNADKGTGASDADDETEDNDVQKSSTGEKKKSQGVESQASSRYEKTEVRKLQEGEEASRRRSREPPTE